MNKIAIIDDDFYLFRGSFDFLNQTSFSGKLEFSDYSRSQEFPFEKINEFLMVFIDIGLAADSETDGFGIVKKIILETQHPNVMPKLTIITGSDKVKTKLIELLVSMKTSVVEISDISILNKPIDYNDLKEVFDKIQVL